MNKYINKIFHKDCLDLMNEMPKGQIDLIYIDPPFCCEADKFFGMPAWSKNIQSKNRVDEILPLTEEICGKGQVNYLRWIYPRLYLMRELLSDEGSIYVHVDWHVGHYVKILMDEIFGKSNLVNEIIWSYQGTGEPKSAYKRKHDTILFYSKNSDYIFNEEHASEEISDFSKTKYNKVDENGNLYKEIRHSDGKVYRQYIKENMRMRDVWTIPIINAQAKERLDYTTQKPEALLEQIIKVSSNENSIVADFFAGSGTTLAVAEKLGRKWLGCDTNEKAVKIAINRICAIR